MVRVGVGQAGVGRGRIGVVDRAKDRISKDGGGTPGYGIQPQTTLGTRRRTQ